MKTVREAIWRVAFVAVLLICLPAGRLAAQQAGSLPVGAQEAAAPDSTTQAVTAADDAYHYAAWKDGHFDSYYTEWWYFNFHDELSGVRAIFSYFVTDPDNLSGLGHSRMVAVAYTRKEVLTADDIYPVAAFTGSDASASATIDSGTGEISTMEARPDGSCALKGMTHDRRLTWDLVYTPAATPWAAADRLRVGTLSWEQMSWLVGMPRAMVTGSVTIDGRKRIINAPGYHDHNWGEWVPTDALWDWGQYNSPWVSLEMGDFIGKSAGLIALDVAGVRTVFTHDQYTLKHDRWGFDRVNSHYYPIASTLKADNGSVRLNVSIKTLKTDPLRAAIPRPLPDVLIYEQTASYIGRVWVAVPPAAGSPEGTEPTWVGVAWLWGVGFKEHTGVSY